MNFYFRSIVPSLSIYFHFSIFFEASPRFSRELRFTNFYNFFKKMEPTQEKLNDYSFLCSSLFTEQNFNLGFLPLFLAFYRTELQLGFPSSVTYYFIDLMTWHEHISKTA